MCYNHSSNLYDLHILIDIHHLDDKLWYIMILTWAHIWNTAFNSGSHMYGSFTGFWVYREKCLKNKERKNYMTRK